ncbi:MAG TPA: hypothetical protein VFX20_04255 [Steroidobacteraceae bacterium]|nr:hypothetical protein [Steroidobacteraceae bacterium]
MSPLRFVSRLALATAATTLLAAVPALAAAQDSVAAVWVPKKVQFVYQGFTTHYSCDGLQDKIRSMLEKLGARDLKVQQFACVRPSGPTLFPGVRVTMHVLVPASSADASKDKSAGAPVQAQWKSVVLMPANASYNDQGNCELIEQFKETFLPLFSTRNVKYSSTCVPHQITLGTHLSAEVLVPPAKMASGNGS